LMFVSTLIVDFSTRICPHSLLALKRDTSGLKRIKEAGQYYKLRPVRRSPFQV
jgi:hypothetical protein